MRATINFSVFLFNTCTVQTFNSCTSWPVVCQCQIVQIPMNNMSKNKPSTPMTHVACESKLVSFVRSYMHQGPRNLAAIRHAVVYNAQAAHAFSAGIKCLHCTCREVILYCMFIDCTILYKLLYIRAYFFTGMTKASAVNSTLALSQKKMTCFEVI